MSWSAFSIKKAAMTAHPAFHLALGGQPCEAGFLCRCAGIVNFFWRQVDEEIPQSVDGHSDKRKHAKNNKDYNVEHR